MMNDGANYVMAFMVKNIYTTALYKENRSESAERLGLNNKGVSRRKENFKMFLSNKEC